MVPTHPGDGAGDDLDGLPVVVVVGVVFEQLAAPSLAMGFV